MSLDARLLTPQEFIQVAQNVRKVFYWEKKDLSTYVALTKHLLATAIANRDEGGQYAKEFGERVLGLGYDLGSMTWPGWDEEGIEMTEQARMDGLEASKMILDLSQASAATDEVRFNHYWLYGAHLLTDHKFAEALAAWKMCLDLKPDDTQVGPQYWVMLAEALASDSFDGLNAELISLESLGPPQAGIAGQIRTAMKVALA